MSLSLWNEPFFTIVPSFGDIHRELRRMDRELNQLLSPSKDSSTSNAVTIWSPTCDVSETEKDIVIHAELPGVPKENINIELKDSVLTISGERNQEKKEENEKWHRTERSFGKFVRSMAVPRGLQQDQIHAKFENGVLEVTFPKPEEPKKEVKKIKIN